MEEVLTIPRDLLAYIFWYMVIGAIIYIAKAIIEEKERSTLAKQFIKEIKKEIDRIEKEQENK